MQLHGDEPTVYLMALSLAKDGDLSCEVSDLERLYEEFPFIYRPALKLRSGDGWSTASFDGPLLYTLVGAPWVVAFGANGLVALNAMLFLLAILLAATTLRDDNDEGMAWLFAIGFFTLSAAWLYVFRLQSEIFALCAVTACLTLGRRTALSAPSKGKLLSALASGLALAPAIEHQPALALLALPIAGALLERRAWRAFGAWLAGGALAVLLSLVAHQLSTPLGDGTHAPERALASIENPLQMPELPADITSRTATWTGRSLGARLTQFLWGRHTGLLVYFPFILVVLGLFAPRKKMAHQRSFDIWGAVVGVILTLLALPTFGAGSDLGDAIGNPHLVAAYPGFLLLVARLRPAAILAGFAWTATTLGMLLWTPFGAPIPDTTSQGHARGWLFSALPMETYLLPRLADHQSLPVPGGRLWSRTDQVTLRADELWLLGGERVELWLEQRTALADAVLDLRDLASSHVIELDLAGEDIQLDFVNVGEQGEHRRLELTPTAPSVALRDGDETVFLYRLAITTKKGENLAWRKEGHRFHHTGAVLTYLGSQEELERDLYQLEWLGCGAPSEVRRDETFRALARLRNTSEHSWPARGAARVRLSYHWLDENGDKEVWEGTRTELEKAVPPTDIVAQWLDVTAPATPGNYILELEPLFERVTWFSGRNPRAGCRAEIEVR